MPGALLASQSTRLADLGVAPAPVVPDRGTGPSLSELGYRLANGKVASAIKSGFTYPGDVYAGRAAPDDIGRNMDLAGLATLGAAPMPRPTGAVSAGLDLPFLRNVKPATDDPYEVMEAAFPHGQYVGNKTMDIKKLAGGVDLADPEQAARVSALAEKMRGEGGHISRLIVDADGNVMEGQHRLEALRSVGATKVPVTVIRDLSTGFNVDAMKEAARAAGLNSDNRNQIVTQVLEMIAEAGGADKVASTFQFPRGWESKFQAVLDAAKANATTIPEGGA